MREQVMAMVENAIQLATESLDRSREEANDPNQLQVAEGQTKPRWQLNADRLYLIQECIRACPNVTNVYFSTTYSLNVEWGVDPFNHNNIVLETSMYVNLAAIFTYGVPPANITPYIIECLEKQDLIILTKEELNELEKNGTYLTIL